MQRVFSQTSVGIVLYNAAVQSQKQQQAQDQIAYRIAMDVLNVQLLATLLYSGRPGLRA